MMRTVVLVTQKGGTGKSTLATNLAVAAGQAGETVVLFDLDPQGTSVAWGKLRDADTPVVVTVPPDRVADLGGVLKSAASRFTLAIVDTAGADNPVTRSAMKLGNFAFVPLRPTRPDGIALKPTVEALIISGRRFAFVLNQCPPNVRSSRASEMAAGLSALGVLAEPMIHLRADYQDAFAGGQGVTEFAPKGAAADEIRGLWKWTDRSMKGDA